MKKIYTFFDNLKTENKLSHSFLIGNVLYDDVKDELEEVINKILIDSKMNIEENPDVYILRNNEKEVSKDDIKDLLNNVNKTSQFHNGKVYIIENSEKLNDFACNALLKTLEEPPSGVFAILLTSNVNDIKDTIYSRCQKIFVSTTVETKETDEEIEKISRDLIESIEQKGVNIISEDYGFYSIINERKQFQRVLRNMLYKYKSALDCLLSNDNTENIISKNNNIKELANKIIVINDNINRLEVPLNKSMMIDRFIIEMWRCKNENS